MQSKLFKPVTRSSGAATPASSRSRPPPAVRGTQTVDTYLGGKYWPENNTIWKMFKAMLAIAESGGDIGQCQPKNFLYNKARNAITMRPKNECEVDPHYTSMSPNEQTARVYALGKTLQKVLTGQTAPLDHCEKFKYGLSDAAWNLLNKVVTEGSWKTYAQIKASAWWMRSPDERASLGMEAKQAKGWKKLRSDYEAKSK